MGGPEWRPGGEKQRQDIRMTLPSAPRRDGGSTKGGSSDEEEQVGDEEAPPLHICSAEEGSWQLGQTGVRREKHT